MITNKRIASLLNSSSLLVLGSAVLGAGPAQAFDANALPQGGTVTGGAATFAQSGNTLTVNQSSTRAVIDWRSFDIGSNAQANFNQPGSSAIAVNRVNGGTDPSRIDGGLRANGQVWILNPNGVFFGKTARVDAAGIVASTANIDANAFMAGSNRLQMRGGSTGSVVNEGQITVGQGGLAAFVAPSVRNSGTIRATVGKVTLAAGETFTLDLAGDRLVELGLGSGNAVVDNSGQIVNAGGVVTISAKAAGQVVDSVINMSGVVDASSVASHGGQIVLGADNIVTAASAQLKADGAVNGGTITAIANKTGDYAGSFSARGGSGNGGLVETSGKKVRIDSGIAIDTRSAGGKTGNWTIDPDDLTVVAGADEGAINPNASTVNNATVVNKLATTSVTLMANNSITVNGAIDSSAQGNSSVLALNDQNGGTLTVNLNAPITLGASQQLTGQATTVNLANGARIQNGVNVALAGATLNLGAGRYASGAVINKNGLTLAGLSGAVIDVSAGTNGLTVQSNDVTISGLEIAGPADQSYLTYAWGGTITRGIFVQNGATNFSIANNNIHGTRNNILVDGRNTGSITGNIIDNSKSGISVQYTDTTGYDKSVAGADDVKVVISGNSQGPYGNEWGVNLHLNGYWNGVPGDMSNPNPNPVVNGIYLANAPTSAWQQAMLALSASNGGMTIQDQAYASSNRTAVTVSTTGSDTNQGSPLGSLATLTKGVDAVVSGGQVNLMDGAYTLASQLNITKGVTLSGQSRTGTVLTSNATGYGINVTADNVTLRNFTFNAPTAVGSATYGIKVTPDTGTVSDRLLNFGISNVAINGGYRTGLDLNGVSGGTINNVSVSGVVRGNGVALTDSADVTLTGVNTSGNAWGGLALYQTNRFYDQQVDNISVDASNSFSDTIPVYAQDESASRDFGSIALAGFGYVVKSPNNPASIYSWFQKAQQGAVNFATDAALSNNNINLPTATVQGYSGSGVNGNNVFTVGTGINGTAMSIATAAGQVVNGGAINVLAGTYASGASITANNVTLSGIPGAVINVTAGTNGVNIFGNGVTVRDLEIAGPADQSYLTYGWGGTITRGIVVNRGATDFNITNNNIHGTRNNILVDGRNTGSITGNIIDNSKSGISVQYTDTTGYDKSLPGSDDVKIVINNNSQGTHGNEWGVNLHLNGYWNGVAGDELNPNPNPVVNGIYLANAPTAAWHQGMLDLSAANGGMTVQDQAYASSNRTAVTVSTTGSDTNQGSPLGALATITKGIDAVVSGGTVNVKDGSHVLPSQLNIAKSLTLAGESRAGTILTSNATGYGINVTGDDVTLQDFTFNAPAAVGGSTYGIKVTPDTGTASDRLLNFDISNVTINGGYRTGLDLNGVMGATIDNVSVNNVVRGNGIALTDSADVTLTNVTTGNNAWGGLALYQTNRFYDQQVDNVSVDGGNSFNDTIPVYAQDESASNDFGSIALAGFGYLVKSPDDPADAYTWFQKTQQDAVNFATDAALSNGNVNVATATVQGYSGNGVDGNNVFTVGIGANGSAMSMNEALDQSAAGGTINVLSGDYDQDMVLLTPRTVNFDNVTLNELGMQAAADRATLSGNVVADSVTLSGGINLGGDLTIDTSTAAGTIAMLDVDGNHDLTLNAGTGVVMVGNMGATSRLGAVETAADMTFLDGDTYQAGNFEFGGDVTVTATDTVIDSTQSAFAAGNISFAGDIFGLIDGDQNLTLTAGPGTGVASANGDITLNNAGLSTVRLGDLTVNGDDFSADTVHLAGDFTSQLTGNQVFTANTLNAAGNVTSNAAGNVSGHIVSGGNVTMNAGGTLTGEVSGQAMTLGAGNGINGTFSGATVTLTAPTVSGRVTAGSLNVSASQGGTINGTWTQQNVSNGVVLNGQTVVPNVPTIPTVPAIPTTPVIPPVTPIAPVTPPVTTPVVPPIVTPVTPPTPDPRAGLNPRQLVVENFVLPVGTQIGANGELILPAGQVIGLLSPGGGQSRVIMVHDVRTLGELLAAGYTAIVIDLDPRKQKPTQVASN